MPRNSEIANHIKIGSVLMALFEDAPAEKIHRRDGGFHRKFIQLSESEVHRAPNLMGQIEEAQNSSYQWIGFAGKIYTGNPW